MATLKVWYDEEGDFLEIIVREGHGHSFEAAPDVYKRVDEQGRLLGFSVFGFRKRGRKPIEIDLQLAERAQAG